MATRLADRLRVARHRQFVGRENERALFKSALQAPDLPFSVLHVFGPGGVGKTTLLKEFEYLAEQEGVTPLYIDARNVEAAPGPFVAALQLALGLTVPESPLDVLAARPNRQVILVDTYETLAPPGASRAGILLPAVPGHVRVVLATIPRAATHR